MKNLKKISYLTIIALLTAIIFGTQTFADENEERLAVISLVLQGSSAVLEGEALSNEQQEELMKNLTAGVNGVPGELKDTGAPLSKTFLVGTYDKDKTYFITYKGKDKEYTYKFNVNPDEIPSGEKFVGTKGSDYPNAWRGYARIINTKDDCKSNPNGKCLMMTFVIALK